MLMLDCLFAGLRGAELWLFRPFAVSSLADSPSHLGRFAPPLSSIYWSNVDYLFCFCLQNDNNYTIYCHSTD